LNVQHLQSAERAILKVRRLVHHLSRAASVITVVVRSELYHMFLKRPGQEKQTGRTIESLNPHSKFILKKDEDHKDIAKYWLEQLKYIIQFKKIEAISMKT
jgi:hypothetical protein